jgi:hypothetical protein
MPRRNNRRCKYTIVTTEEVERSQSYDRIASELVATGRADRVILLDGSGRAAAQPTTRTRMENYR